MSRKQMGITPSDDFGKDPRHSANAAGLSPEECPHKRDGRIDNLKCLAILSVIWAHTSIPSLVMHYRTYDVVLLFLLSGMSLFLSRQHSSSAGKEKESLGSYIWVRIRKLLLPAYAVITVSYFTIVVLCFLFHQEQLFPLQKYLLAILLTNRGLGFVWIIKIFLLAALLSPWFCSISAKIRNDGTFLILIVGGLLMQMLLCMGTACLVRNGIPFFLQVILEDYIAGCFGYLVVYAAGIRLIQSKPFCRYLLAASLLLFLIMQLQYQSFCPNSAKYPPNLYYLSYGLLVSSILWMVIPSRSCRFTEWVGKRSYDIYLFHILFYYIAPFISIRKWQICYPYLLLGAFLLTWIWPAVADKIKYFFRLFSNYLKTAFSRLG